MNDISKDPAAFLSNTLFVPEIRAKDKPGVLAELSDVVVARGIVPADRRDEVLAALADREEKMSTGMQYGVAIPHAKTEVVDRLVTMIAISRDGISSPPDSPLILSASMHSTRGSTASHGMSSLS